MNGGRLLYGEPAEVANELCTENEPENVLHVELISAISNALNRIGQLEAQVKRLTTKPLTPTPPQEQGGVEPVMMRCPDGDPVTGMCNGVFKGDWCQSAEPHESSDDDEKCACVASVMCPPCVPVVCEWVKNDEIGGWNTGCGGWRTCAKPDDKCMHCLLPVRVKGGGM